MSFAVNLDVIGMYHVQDGLDHLWGGVGSDVLVGGAGVEIKMDSKETLVPAEAFLPNDDIRAG